MTEVDKVSIGGYAFTLEKDASKAASEYLAQLDAHYRSQQGGKEIMEGIEERMAELLLEKCGGMKAVTLADINSVIEILGRPEKIEADDNADTAGQEYIPRGRKKFFRDIENKTVGGVCAGLAAYFDIDVVWPRLIFAVFTVLGLMWNRGEDLIVAMPLIYGILWMVMPAAKTAQDRWAMRGDAGTFDDVARNVGEGLREMRDAAQDAVQSRGGRNLARVIVLIVGVLLLAVGTSGLASVSVISLKGNDLFGAPYAQWLERPSMEAPGVYDMVTEPWVMCLLVAGVLLPLIGIIYGGLQLVFNFKVPSWKPGLVIFILWLIVLVVLSVVFGLAAFSNQLIVI